MELFFENDGRIHRFAQTEVSGDPLLGFNFSGASAFDLDDLEIRSLPPLPPGSFQTTGGVKTALQAAEEVLEIPADATRSRTHARDLRVFYDRILRELPGAGDLLLLGPGRAKTDFRKHLQSTGWAGRVLAVKSADKMSDRQFAALVREFFQRPDETPSPAYRPWYTSASASRMLSSSVR